MTRGGRKSSRWRDARLNVQSLEPRHLLAGPFSVDAGGPYTIHERASLTLSGSASRAATNWEWDLNYTAATGFQVDATGQFPRLDGNLLDGPSTRTIAVRASDDKNRSDLDTATVNVVNAAPDAFLKTSGAAYPGEPVEIGFAVPTDSQPDLAAGFTHEFDLDNDGTFEVNTGNMPTTQAPDWMIRTPGRYDIRGRLTDKDGASDVDTFYVLIHPPYVSLTDQAVPEGGTANLTVGYSVGTQLTYEWDFDYDGTTFHQNGVGPSVAFNASGLDGPLVLPMAVRATDAYGNRSIATAKLTVTNVAPRLSVGMPSAVYEGTTAHIYTLAYEDSPGDRGTLIRRFDFGNDGTFDASVDRGDGVLMPIPADKVPDGPGTLQVRIAVFDDDGGVDEEVHTVAVTNLAPTATLKVDATDVGVATTARVIDIAEPSTADRPSLRFSYDFDNNGAWDIVETDQATVTVPGSYLTKAGNQAMRLRVIDKDGGFTTSTTYAVVSPGTTARILTGDSLTIPEGERRVLQGTYTISALASDHLGDTNIAWDFDYDGATFEPDAMGPGGDLPAIDGPAQRVIAFRVVDSRGVTAIDTMTLTVQNVAPQSTHRLGPTAVPEGTTDAPRLQLLGVSDPYDLAVLRFSFDFDGDGTFDVVDSWTPEALVPLELLRDGTKVLNIRARVADDDGGFTDYAMPITVADMAPVITLNGATSVKVGETYTLSIDVTDVGDDTISAVVVDWRDGTTTSLPPGTLTATKVFAGPQTTRSVEVRVTNEDGTFANKRSVFVDAPPVVSRFTFAVDVGFSSASAPRGPRLVVAISENVGTSFTIDDLVLTNLTTGQSIAPSTAVFGGTVGTNEGRGWRWPNGLPDGDYEAVIPAGSITDTTGNASTQDSIVSFFILAGDANRDRTVNFDDLLIVAQNYGLASRTYSQGNFNYSTDGSVTFDDLLILAQRYGTSLPAAASLTAGPPTDKARRRPPLVV